LRCRHYSAHDDDEDDDGREDDENDRGERRHGRGDDDLGLDGLDAELDGEADTETEAPTLDHDDVRVDNNDNEPLYDPAGTGPAPGKRTKRIDMTKWCALCERDGHESVDCPFEEEW